MRIVVPSKCLSLTAPLIFNENRTNDAIYIGHTTDTLIRFVYTQTGTRFRSKYKPGVPIQPTIVWISNLSS